MQIVASINADGVTGSIFATHDDATVDPALYPGCRVFYWPGPPPQIGGPLPDTVANLTAATTTWQTQSARADMLGGVSPTATGARAGDAALHYRVNDVAEGLFAVIQLVAAAANVPMPTANQIAAQIATNRGTNGIPGASDPATVAAQCGVRLDQATIVATTLGLLAAGAGDPLPSSTGLDS
ncbi:hypothetical protein [Fimbriiglobus ruber]|nr:hypothetical protein [Fimbriiglobus ruber]